MKLASIFIKASAVNIRGLPQIYEQTSEKYEACFNIYQSECSKYSRFTSNITTNFNKTEKEHCF